MHNADLCARVTASVDDQRNKGSPRRVGWMGRTWPTGMSWIPQGVQVGMGLEDGTPM